MRSKWKFTQEVDSVSGSLRLKRQCIIRIRKLELETGRVQFMHKCKKIFQNNEKDIWKCNRKFQVVKMITQIFSKESTENISCFGLRAEVLSALSLLFCLAFIRRFHLPAHLLTQRISSSLFMFNEEKSKIMIEILLMLLTPSKYKRKWKTVKKA